MGTHMKNRANKWPYFLCIVALITLLVACGDNDLTSLEVAKLMGNGTNLGNTMEAYGHDFLGSNADVKDYETLWGQPETTKEMIDGLKEAGFDSLRIPVAWTNMMDFENGDYTINTDYLDRVATIVDYAIDADLYVIVNDHWDGGWWGMFGSANEETRASAMNLYTSMWTQIAERFEKTSTKLIFESANEELGSRLNDVTVAKDSGTLDEDACYEMTNIINQRFVDTIRQTSGHNKSRFLLIAGYNTDITATCDQRFFMPTDTAKDKLLLSVHYYTPWSYCGTDSVTQWGTEHHYKEQNDLLEKMTKFTDDGYGVVIGEFAVLLKSDGTLKDNTVDFTKNVLDNCDLYGYAPMLWDTNSFYKKDQLIIVDESLAALYKGRSYELQSSMTDEALSSQALTSLHTSMDYAISHNTDINKTLLTEDYLPIAWIMYNSSDYNVTYSVGDQYDPSLSTEGVIGTDIEITGPGTYTVGLDFTGTNAGLAFGTAFSALAINYGELHYPGYIINITEVLINEEAYDLSGIPYTTSDDDQCTRVNLYNEWVSSIPDDARTSNGDPSNVSAILLSDLGEVTSMTITFEYGPND